MMRYFSLGSAAVSRSPFFLASGIMKVFMFDSVSKDVPSFGALPKKIWISLGVLELVCVMGLVIPAALHWNPGLTGWAALVLALEALLFIAVHIKYREVFPILFLFGAGLIDGVHRPRR
ncbi:MAG: DoxX family protein [Pirellulales bacterium]